VSDTIPCRMKNNASSYVRHLSVRPKMRTRLSQGKPCQKSAQSHAQTLMGIRSGSGDLLIDMTLAAANLAIHACSCMRAHTHKHTYTLTHSHTRTNTHTDTHEHTHVQAHTRASTHTCKHTHAHRHTHTNTLAHTHTQV